MVVNPIDPSALMTGISWDSREIGAGDLYVALPGERVDGHDFVAQALQAGAAGALVMQPLPDAVLVLAREMGAAVIEVANTQSAITDLAREWRAYHLKGRIIGLTGSTGKTTTKNLVRDVLASKHSVVATLANQNNELGVPRTLLNANPETEAVVVEMGMRGLGQIAELCELAKPHWGVVVNAGEAHIELLGSRENIARAKAELFEALPMASGVAFVNGADDMADFMVEHARLSERLVTSVCCDGSGDYVPITRGPEVSSWRARPAVWAEDIRLDDQGRPSFMLCCRGFAEGWPPDVDDSRTWRQEVSLGLRGLHNVSNSCQAAAVGLMMGIDLPTIAQALADALPEEGRQEVIKARGGFTIVNDAYNANPDSMKASLSMFCSMEVRGKRYAVLGDMGELGEFAAACHEGVGEFAAGQDVDMLVCVGELSERIAEGARAAGMDEGKIMHVDAISDVLRELDARLEPGDAVLVKASHFMGLERVVEGLVS